VDNGAFVAAGYVITALALGGYAASLFRRASRARARVRGIVDARPNGSGRAHPS
jgi:hypothetical protein